MTDKEKITVLERKLAEYEEILKKLKGGNRVIADLLTPTYSVGEDMWARVSSGGTDQVVAVNNSVMFKKGKLELEVGDEVVLLENNLVDVVPKELKPKKELAKMKLAKWEDIGGYGAKIQQIKASVETVLQNKKEAELFGVEPAKGIALYGPPGCGKTLIAKAIAQSVLGQEEVDVRAFTYVKGPELLHGIVGATEAKIRHLFRSARDYTKETGNKAIIFIDEADAILNKRGSRWSSDVDMTIVPMFLAEMDGLDDHSPFVLLATNRLEALDEAILRPGRMDLKIEIERPEEAELKAILNIHLAKKTLAEDKKSLVELGVKALISEELLPKRSGAMAEALVKVANQSAFTRYLGNKKIKKGITAEDIVQAANSLVY